MAAKSKTSKAKGKRPGRKSAKAARPRVRPEIPVTLNEQVSPVSVPTPEEIDNLSDGELSPRQNAFILHYLNGVPATEAYQLAGFITKSYSAAAAGACYLLKCPKIYRAIRAWFVQRTERVEIDKDYLIAKLVENLERSMRARPVFDALGHPTGEYQYEGNVANQSAKLIAQMLGMIQLNVNHRGKVDVDHSGQVGHAHLHAHVEMNGKKVLLKDLTPEERLTFWNLAKRLQAEKNGDTEPITVPALPAPEIAPSSSTQQESPHAASQTSETSS